MARIIPSGDAFARKAPRTAIQYAPADTSGSFLSGLERVATSPLTNLAVAGISRIADELDYADREKAENQRRAAVELEMRGLEKRKRQIANVQAERAAVAAGERAPIPGFRQVRPTAPMAGYTDEQLEAQRQVIASAATSAQQQAPARQMGVGAPEVIRLPTADELHLVGGEAQEGIVAPRVVEGMYRPGTAAFDTAQALSEEENRILAEQLRRQQEAQHEWQRPERAAAIPDEQYTALMGKLKGTRLEGKSPEELQDLVDRVRSLPGVASGGSWRDSGIKPGDDGYEELVALQDSIDALEIDKSIFKGEVVRDGMRAWSGPRTAKAVDMLSGYIDRMEAARATAPPERRGALDAKIAEFQAQIDALRPEMEKRFVPRTLADYKMVVRDTERQMLQAKTPEERARLKKKLDSTISQARRAVDVQPTSLLEAITGKAGMGAQKKAYDEMTAVEKEFTKQMAEAAKEKRAVRADERAEGAAARAESAEARAQELHPEKLKKAEADARKAQVSAARAARRSLGGKPLTPQGKKAVASASEHVAEMIGGGGQTMVIDGKTYTPESAASAVMAGNLYPGLPRTGRKATAAAFADGRKSVGPGMRAEGGRLSGLVSGDEGAAKDAQDRMDSIERDIRDRRRDLFTAESAYAATQSAAARESIQPLITKLNTEINGLNALWNLAKARRDTARSSAGMRAFGGRATMHGNQPVTVMPK